MSDTGKKDSGLSLRQTEALFGAGGMNVAQQGAELLRRGKRIDQLEAEIGRLREVAEIITEIWEDVVTSHALHQKAYTSPEDKYMQVLGEAVCALSKILHKERE